MNPLHERLASFLTRLPSVNGYCLAFSGGLDSSVLLDVLAQNNVRDRLRAVHINHQLQVSAEEWAEHCCQRCRHYGVPITVISVNARGETGDSPEAAAREARYRALRENLQSGEVLLTAQHRNDQAETILLQLLRGSGPAGLAAMPELARFEPGWLGRPWLDCERDLIRRYAEDQRLPWVEDTSNNALEYDRNYLRAMVMPLLLQRWPGALKTLARSAGHQAEVCAMLDELGGTDLAAVRCPQQPTVLLLPQLRVLSAERQRNVLRHWIAGHDRTMPSARQLQQVMEILDARPESAPLVSWSGGGVGCYQDALYLLPGHKPPPKRVWSWFPPQGLSIPELDLDLTAIDLEKIGLRLERITRPLTLRFRHGGERIRLSGRKHRHQLKKLLQEREVPPWLRAYLPLLFYDDELIAVLGLDPPIIADGWRKV